MTISLGSSAWERCRLQGNRWFPEAAWESVAGSLSLDGSVWFENEMPGHCSRHIGNPSPRARNASINTRLQHVCHTGTMFPNHLNLPGFGLPAPNRKIVLLRTRLDRHCAAGCWERTMTGYDSAKSVFAEWGIDTEFAIARLQTIPISVHCWQGDDISGFEQGTGTSGGGILATGDHPGRARTPDELRADLDFAYSMIPGKHRLNLHAMYMDTDKSPDRDEIEYLHFESWVDWAKAHGIGLDFNPTFFAHAKADDNLTLSHPDKGIREFWIEHGRRTREIAARMGAELGSPTVNNIWVPDGFKDTPVDRMAARTRLEASLDEMLEVGQDKRHLLDAVESKTVRNRRRGLHDRKSRILLGICDPQGHNAVS